jgi:hypothetical protein
MSKRSHTIVRLFLLFLLVDGRIRIREDKKQTDPDPSLFVRIRILPSSSKNSKKNLDFYCFVTSL